MSLDSLSKEIIAQHSRFPISSNLKKMWRQCKSIPGLIKQKLEGYKSIGSNKPRIVIRPDETTRNVVVYLYDSAMHYIVRLWPDSKINLSSFVNQIHKSLNNIDTRLPVCFHKNWKQYDRAQLDILQDAAYLAERVRYFAALSVVDIPKAIADELNNLGRKTTKEEVEIAMRKIKIESDQKILAQSTTQKKGLLQVTQWSSEALEAYNILYNACLLGETGADLIDDFSAKLKTPSKILRSHGLRSCNRLIKWLCENQILQKLPGSKRGIGVTWLFRFAETPSEELKHLPEIRHKKSKTQTSLRQLLQELQIPTDKLKLLAKQYLPEREQKIICLYAGIGQKPVSLEKIAKELNLSRTWIRKLCIQAIEKLKMIAKEQTQPAAPYVDKDPLELLNTQLQQAMSRIEKLEHSLSRAMSELQFVINEVKSLKSVDLNKKNIANVANAIVSFIKQQINNLLESFYNNPEILGVLIFNEEIGQTLKKTASKT